MVLWLFHPQAENKLRCSQCTTELRKSSKSWRDWRCPAPAKREEVLGVLKLVRKNKNNGGCKGISNTYWFWNEISQNQGSITWIDRKVTIVWAWGEQIPVGLRGFGLSSHLGVASHSRWVILGLSEHVSICKLGDFKTTGQNSFIKCVASCRQPSWPIS